MIQSQLQVLVGVAILLHASMRAKFWWSRLPGRIKVTVAPASRTSITRCSATSTQQLRQRIRLIDSNEHRVHTDIDVAH
ncbi:hypothetical protein LIA77_00067 [Sarocladium implicatum]|nr:hypothetical protein LIA77_00067 [Sarocladium implicatum]